MSMKVRILGIQPGTVTEDMTNEEYFSKQLMLAEQKFSGEELIVFPELMTGKYFGYVREKTLVSVCRGLFDRSYYHRYVRFVQKIEY